MDKSIGHAVWAKSFPWHQILIVSDGWSVGRFGREGQAELFRISLKLRDLRRHQEDVCGSSSPRVLFCAARESDFPHRCSSVTIDSLNRQ